ncbi:MAG TPA: aldose 1-epimerase [Leptospiraceae bacterium]|nr:aldose 1-epimerase [Leptospiraceae bacterium]
MIFYKFIIYIILLFTVHCGKNEVKPPKVRYFPENFYLYNRSSPLRAEILPGIGNTVFQIYSHGRTVLFSPVPREDLLKTEQLIGIPLMFPWANRLEGNYFYHNDKKYILNDNKNTLRRDKNGLPIHGLILKDKNWKPEIVRNSETGSYYDSSFSFGKEFQNLFPFEADLRQEIELIDNKLIFTLTVKNGSSDSFPLSLGYHPYFLVSEEDRKTVSLFTNASSYYETDSKLIPTGKKKKSSSVLPKDGKLEKKTLDTVFTDFPKGALRYSVLNFKKRNIRLELIEGFDHLVLFVPEGKDFICMEPMLGPTNVFNLAHRKKYKGLQKLDPGRSFRASFSIQITEHPEEIHRK